MKITYTNPAPDEDMYPGEAVHWHDRGGRYFDYKDLWFEQLDRHYLVSSILEPIDRSEEKDASGAIAYMLGVDPSYPKLRKIGLITPELPIASAMLSKGVDFVFDHTTQLFFFDLRGRHEALMGDLYQLHSGKRAKSSELEAELFVSSGLGIFKSTTSPYVHLGENTPCPTWLKTSQFPLRRI
jgi:hypothetical protein